MKSSPNATGFLFRVRLSTESQMHQAFVHQEKFSIGSGPSLPVVVKEKSIELEHLVVSCVENQIWLTDQKTIHGTKVNGQAIKADTPYHYCPGDIITLGQANYNLQLDLFTHAFDENVESPRLRQAAIQRAMQIGQNRISEAQSRIEAAKSEGEALKAKAEKLAEEIVTRARADAGVRAKEIIAAAKEQAKEVVAKEIEVLRKQATEEAKALALKENARATADATRYAEEIRIAGRKEYEEKRKQLNDEALALRKNSAAQVTEILQKAASDGKAQIETARREAAELIAQAKTEAEKMTAAARGEAEHLILQGKQTAEQIENAAYKKSEDAFIKSEQAAEARARMLIEELESKSLEVIKKREAEVQSVHEKALAKSEEILNDARKQAAGIIHRVKMDAAKERTAEISKVMSDATAAAEKVKQQAHWEAERIVEAGRTNSIAARLNEEKELAAIYEDAQKTAHAEAKEIHNRAQEAANALLAESRKKIFEMQDSARKEADQLVIASRTACETMHRTQEQESAKILEEARATAKNLILENQEEIERRRVQAVEDLDKIRFEADEIRRQSLMFKETEHVALERELDTRRRDLESELNKLRIEEIENIDHHWQLQARRAADDRRHAVDILSANLEAGLRALVENALAHTLNDEQWSRIHTDLHRTVTQSMALETNESTRSIMNRVFSLGRPEESIAKHRLAFRVASSVVFVILIIALVAAQG